MTIAEFNNIIRNFSKINNWNLYALKYSHPKTKNSTYETKKIVFHDRSELFEYITMLQKEYCEKRLKCYEGVYEYDGSCDSNKIYFLHQTNNIIAIELKLLNESLANPNMNCNIDGNENAVLIQGTFENHLGDKHSIKLVSIRKPFVTLKNRFYYEEGEYSKIREKVLNLVNTFDVLIWDSEKIFFMNLIGEKLFNMERAYKTICTNTVNEIKKYNIVNDFDLFSKVANSGHNPRRFISYNNDKLQYICESVNRKKILQKFCIAVDQNGTIDSTDPDNITKLVKFLCDKAVLDPATLEPKESNVTRKWK